LSVLEQELYQNIADTMMNPPPDGAPIKVRREYERVAYETAKFFGQVGLEDRGKFGLSLKHRNLVMEHIAKANDFISRATNLGYAPPENPFARIAASNVDREVFEPVDLPPDAELTSIFEAIFQLNKILAADARGEIDLDKHISNSAQLSSLTITTDGLTGVGDASQIAGFVPDADAIKRQRALGALAQLDFSRRVPSLVFTADYSPTGTMKGVLVGWRRMPDASGYIVRRHDVTRNKDVETFHSNDQIAQSMPTYAKYVQEWVLSFYGKESTKNILFVLDRTAAPDSIYLYTVQAYQEVKLRADTVFDTPVATVFLTPKQLTSVSNRLSREVKARAPGALEVDDISPYASLSTELYRSPDYGWILAAVNLIASVSRGDSVERIRKFSFVGSKFSEIKAEIEAGRFVAPADLNVVAASFRQAIASFGVQKVLAEVLDKSGTLFFFGDKDTLSGETLDVRTGLLARMLASIDPETATVDPLLLKSNVSVPINTDPAASALATPSKALDLGTDEDVSSTVSDGEAIFSSFSTDSAIDLLTFEGIGQLMAVLRDFYDFSAREAT
jgi:hypothetical protein